MKRKTSTKNKIFGEHIHFFFIKCVTGKCYVVVVQNNVKEMYKKVCCPYKIIFLVLIRLLIFVVLVLVAVAVLHCSILCFVRVNYKFINKSFPFSPGWMYILFTTLVYLIFFGWEAGGGGARMGAYLILRGRGREGWSGRLFDAGRLLT